MSLSYNMFETYRDSIQNNKGKKEKENAKSVIVV
jgi:hypothetical protein